jgi:hypothetical protein
LQGKVEERSQGGPGPSELSVGLGYPSGLGPVHLCIYEGLGHGSDDSIPLMNIIDMPFYSGTAGDHIMNDLKHINNLRRLKIELKK